MGAGKSDHVQGNPQFRPIDQVVADMHGLFQAAGLKLPYVLVGASDGALLARRYQRQYSSEIAGLVFVDSSHEEMQWGEAVIAPQFDPNWNNSAFLQNNGFLPDHQKLTWHADIPLIVLERSEKAPLSAFQGLTQKQVDAINALWHDYQVDLAGRSKFGQLRIVANSGHRMHMDRPDAIADAIRDVVTQVRSEAHNYPEGDRKVVHRCAISACCDGGWNALDLDQRAASPRPLFGCLSVNSTHVKRLLPTRARAL